MSTAHGKVVTARLTTGTIVLYAASYSGTHWIPATRKGDGTYAGVVESITPVLVPGGRRAQRWYDVVLSSPSEGSGGSTVTVSCSPAQTWWLAAASAKWRAFLSLPALTRDGS